MRRLLALALVLTLVPLAQAADGQFGTFVDYDEGAVWFTLPLDAETPTIVYFDEGAADGDLQSTESVYLHFGGGTTIDPGDLILSSAGARVTAGTGNEGETFTTASNAVALNSLLKFYDQTPNAAAGGIDGKFGNGDWLYIDVDASTDVSTGDLRILKQASKAQGSWVTASDADAVAAHPLSLLPWAVGVVIAAIDLDNDGNLDAGDPLYFDTNEDGLPDTGDLRMTAYRGKTAGQHLAWNDPEPIQQLIDLAGYTFKFDDDDTNDDAVEAAEGIVLDVTNNGAGVADLVLYKGGLSCTTFTHVTSAGCTDVEYLSLTADIVFLDDTGNGFDSTDTVYLRIDGGNLAAGDVRLTAFGSKAAGTKIVGSDGDSGLIPTVAPWDLAYVDIDGSRSYTVGDLVYFDIDNDGLVGPGDLRLVKAGSEPAGRLVLVADDDAERVLDALPGATDGLVYSIDTGSAGFDIDDVVFLNVNEGADAQSEDVRLTASADGKAGTFIDGGDIEDDGVQATALTLRWFNEDASGGMQPDDYVYAIVGAADTAVKDVRLTKLGSSLPGTRLTATGGETGETTSAFSAGHEVRFEDRNGDGKLDVGDRIFLNVDHATEPLGLHLVSYLDFRLTGSGGTAVIGTGSTSGSPPAYTSSSTTATSTVTSTSTSGTQTVTTTTTASTVTVTQSQPSPSTESTGGTSTSSTEAVPALPLVLLIGVLLFAVRRRL